MTNTLFYGDNLNVLQNHVADASVDLVYLDPPFNSNRDYNVLFREQSGADSPAQTKAFGNPCRVTSASGVRRVGEKRPGRNSIFAPSRWG